MSVNNCPEVAAACGEPVISVSGVSKFYEIYEKPAHRLYQMLWRGRKQFYTPFWALKDITFSLQKGDCLGIIGRNGAGKSTLLQIMAGTLTPSTGQVITRGRVAGLLELGSGFNPEFTGRENVRLNAAILGLTKEEIDERFASIAAFADIGDFIDQPVKSYSSGMVVRLAFAVIAHVDAEVMIIDEALAVGDAFFTQKCMRFMRQFMATHTVIFVSHDISAVNSLCNRAILLEKGTIKEMGSPKHITEMYLQEIYEERQGRETEKPAEASQHEPRLCANAEYHDMRLDFINNSRLRNDIEVFVFNEASSAFGKQGITIKDAVLRNQRDEPVSWVVGGEQVRLEILMQAHKDVFSPITGFFLRNSFGQHLFGDNTYLSYHAQPLFVPAGKMFRASFSFTMPILQPGDYSISIAVAEGTQQEHIQHDWKHDAIILKAVGENLHRGLVGIPMRDISLSIEKN